MVHKMERRKEILGWKRMDCKTRRPKSSVITKAHWIDGKELNIKPLFLHYKLLYAHI